MLRVRGFAYMFPHNEENYVSAVPPPDIGNRVAVRDRVRTAVFWYARRGSSAEETNRVQIAVCLFPLRFALGLNFSCTCSYSTVYEQFCTTFSRLFLIFCSVFSSFSSQDEVTDSKIELTDNRHW